MSQAKPKIGFEVHSRQKDRWRIEATVDTEDDAIAVARSVLLRGSCDGARVVRQKDVAGTTLETEIWKSEAVSRQPVAQLGDIIETPYLCQAVEDFDRAETRAVINRLFRAFLRRHQVTAGELLLLPAPLRRLIDQGRLVPGAIARITRLQAAGADAQRLRTQQLYTLVNSLVRRAADGAIARRRMPRFEPATVDQTLRQLKPGFERDLVLAWHLFGRPNLFSRLGFVCELLTSTRSIETVAWLDVWIADFMAFPDLVVEMAGPRNDRVEGLLAIVRMLKGQPPIGPLSAEIEPLAAPLRAALGRGLLPETTNTLVRLLLDVVEHSSPLIGTSVEEDEKALERLVAGLRRPQGGMMVGGPQMADALARRRLRLQQNRLRQLGMHDVADNLPNRWKPDFSTANA